MNRSTICLLIAGLAGVPAGFVQPSAIPLSVQVGWLVAVLSVALAGGAFWALDRK